MCCEPSPGLCCSRWFLRTAAIQNLWEAAAVVTTEKMQFAPALLCCCLKYWTLQGANIPILASCFNLKDFQPPPCAEHHQSSLLVPSLPPSYYLLYQQQPVVSREVKVMQSGTLAWEHSCCTKLEPADAAQKWMWQLIPHGIASENPAPIYLRHKPCPSLCFRPVIRRAFLITAERCHEAAEITTGQEVTSNSHKISRSPLAKTVS